MSQQNNQAQTYTIGYALSVVCTLLAYWIVVSMNLTSWLTTLCIVLLAITQIIIQLIFFLHVGGKAKPRMTTLLVLATAGVIVILVFGTIWIMNNLNYNMSPGNEIDDHIMQDELIHR